MAEEQDDSQKTEEPTQKRLEEAREKGDIIKSTDVPVWFIFMAGAGVLAAAGPVSRQIAEPLARIMDHPHAFRLSDGGAQKIMSELLMALFQPMAIIFGGLLVAALLGHLVQHPPLWTTEKMKPDLNKMDPIKGIGRMFGMQAWLNLFKAILKFTAVGIAMWYAVWPARARFAEAGELEIGDILNLIQETGGRLFWAALIAVGCIAALDYFLQRQQFMKRMRMSRQEIRDEVKQQEGDPHIKGKLRQIRQERGRKRMMQNVPTATVIITNPTHYAVALKYAPEEHAAPICVAKGVDAVALRIRGVAEEHDVPIIENPPLARALYATVEIDEVVPREHFEAVAKVIGFVMNAGKGRRR